MKIKFRTISAIVVAVLLAVPVPSTSQNVVLNQSVLSNQAVELPSLPLQKRLQLIGKPQIIRGYYANTSVPLIVDDINRTVERKPLPPDSYVLLAGAIPSTLKHGDRLEVQGIIERPTMIDPIHLRDQQTVLRLSTSSPAIKVIAPTKVQLFPATGISSAARITGTIKSMMNQTRYALLINGGYSYADNRASFTNDLMQNRSMLIARGYLPENIIMLNANAGGASGATKVNVQNAFIQLSMKMKPQDILYVYITDHGSYQDNTGYICLWHELMSWGEFAQCVNMIKSYYQIAFALDLCFSGSATRYLIGQNRIIFASSDWNRPSYDISFNGHANGAMTYYFLQAANCPNCQGIDVNADGTVSFAEIFNYVRAKFANPSMMQTPHYNDDTAMPDVTGPLVQGTDGYLGASLSF